MAVTGGHSGEARESWRDWGIEAIGPKACYWRSRKGRIVGGHDGRRGLRGNSAEWCMLARKGSL